MYAVIKTGGKQYKVSQGDVLQIEKLPAAEGDSISFDQVLLIADGGNIQHGTPLLDGKTVTASVVRHGRGKKIEVIKFRRRKHYRKQMGHRQDYTEIQITAIDGKAGDKPVVAKKAAPKKAEKAEVEAKPAAKKKVAKKAPGTKKVAAKKTAAKKTTKKSEKD